MKFDKAWLGKVIGTKYLLLALAAPLALAPFSGNMYFMYVLTLSNTYAISAMAFDIFSGYIGLFNLGFALLFGVGVYTSAYLNLFLVPPGFCILVAGIVAAGASLSLAPSLRLKGAYFSIVSLAFAEIVRLALVHFGYFTGGEYGLTEWGRAFFSPARSMVPLSSSIVVSYYVSLALMISSGIVLYLIGHSRLGLIFRSVKGNLLVSESIGINTVRYKIIALCISGFFAGIAGGFFSSFQMLAEPAEFAIEMTVLTANMAILGGLGTINGPILGAYILTIATEYLRPLVEWRYFAQSLLLIVILIFLPNGIIKPVYSYTKKSLLLFVKKIGGIRSKVA